MAMEADAATLIDQEMALFTGLLPSHHASIEEDAYLESDAKKRRTDSEERAKATAPGTGSGSRAPTGRSSGRGGRASEKQLNEVVLSLTRLAIRHEDALNCLRQDTSFMMFMASSTPGMVEVLLPMAERWKQMRTTSPASITSPLRLILFRAVIEELIARVTRLLEDPKSKNILEESQKMGVVDKDMKFTFRQWNSTTSSLEVMAKALLEPKEVLRMLRNLIPLLVPLVVHRFHALRPLTLKPAAKAFPFILEVGNRTKEAQVVWETLDTLCMNSVWQLVGVQMRHSSLQRSPLATELRKFLDKV